MYCVVYNSQIQVSPDSANLLPRSGLRLRLLELNGPSGTAPGGLADRACLLWRCELRGQERGQAGFGGGLRGVVSGALHLPCWLQTGPASSCFACVSESEYQVCSRRTAAGEGSAALQA